MGGDKALLPVDGRPMALRVVGALRDASCSPVWCQGGDRAALAQLGVDTVPDSMAAAGPVAAIRTALDHAAGTDVVVAACDLVDLDAATVATIVDAADDAIDAVVAHADGRDHLLGWWSATSAARLAELVDGGTRSLRDALARLTVVRLEVPAAVVRNVNRPADLDGTAGDSRA
jgi:molybdopterin-guanine dinucleotide biosynthesis protein A